MKVLFVCYANIGRSQMAKALYNYWASTDTADSAGTGVIEVSPEWKTLGDFERGSNHIASSTIIMREKFGVDIANSPRLQLLPEMLPTYNWVINIADRNQTPNWLRGKNVIWWHVPDLGSKFSEEQVWQNFDRISEKVKQLIELEKTQGDIHALDDDIDAEAING